MKIKITPRTPYKFTQDRAKGTGDWRQNCFHYDIYYAEYEARGVFMNDQNQAGFYARDAGPSHFYPAPPL